MVPIKFSKLILKKRNLKATNDSKLRGARKNSFWLKIH